MNKVKLYRGKLAPVVYKNSLILRDIMPAKLPPVPDTFNVYDTLGYKPVIDMLWNNQEGDCVMASRGHYTRILEIKERATAPQTFITAIPDNAINVAVHAEYRKETGGLDTGLVIMDSLNHWQDDGWVLNGQTYTIAAHGTINPLDHAALKVAMFYLGGACVGVRLPKSAEDQFNKHLPWTIKCFSRILGGHCVTYIGYTLTGPLLVTWGDGQTPDKSAAIVQATWAWHDKYCDESHGIVDSRDKWLTNSAVDETALKNYLQTCINAG